MAFTGFHDEASVRASRRTHISMILMFILTGVVLLYSLAFWLLSPPARGAPLAPLWRIQRQLQDAGLTALFGLFTLVRWCQHQDWRRGTTRLISRQLVIRSRWVLALSLLFSVYAVSLGVCSVLAVYGVTGGFGIYTDTLYGVLSALSILNMLLYIFSLLILPTDE